MSALTGSPNIHWSLSSAWSNGYWSSLLGPCLMEITGAVLMWRVWQVYTVAPPTQLPLLLSVSLSSGQAQCTVLLPGPWGMSILLVVHGRWCGLPGWVPGNWLGVRPGPVPVSQSPRSELQGVPRHLLRRRPVSGHPALQLLSPSWKRHSRDIPSVWSRDLA